MTGYGRYNGLLNDVFYRVEIRSVNHRFCEISVRIPTTFNMFEEKIKRMLQSEIRRGRIDVSIHITGQQILDKTLKVDEGLLQAYLNVAQELKEKYQIEGNLRLQDLFSLEHFFEVEDNFDVKRYEHDLEKSMNEAIMDLLGMRKQEGLLLGKDLETRILSMANVINQIADLSPQVQQAYQARLEKRMEEFLDRKVALDQERLLNEVAFFADKANIDEELTRLKSHAKQFLNVLQDDGAVGRKLDFIVQEMNREINTIGSKAQAVDISKLVINLKSELEILKEQIQNIE